MPRGIKIALIFVFILLAAALLLREELGGAEVWERETTVLGKEGSDHSHQSMIVSINGAVVDFSKKEYQLKDLLAHFEDGNGLFIHKHARGVTLPYFLNTLGITAATDCLTIAGSEYCSNGATRLSSYLNRKPFVDWGNYELAQGDKILINYGTSTEQSIGLLLNSIPDVPAGL